MGIHSRVHFSLVVTNILVSFVWADAGYQVLCQWCTCVKDKSSWMPDKKRGWEDAVTPHKADPNALLVNCSRVHATPFAGDYVWPDVPPKRRLDEHADDPTKSPDVPATRADFSSSGLNGVMKTLPVKETRRLRELSLAHNQITTILTGSLSGLPALRFLDLSHNKLATLPQDTFPLASDPSMASNLKVLLLSHNEFLRVPWEALLRLPKLEWLDLSSNFIESIENGFNGRQEDLVFKAIEVLNLKHNRLTELSTNSASRFTNLKVLDLSWNSISVVPDAFLAESNGTFMNLTELNLDGNPIKSLGPGSFLGSPFLHFLSLSASAELSEVSSEAFDGLEDLRVLKLRKNILLSRLPAKGILREANGTGDRRELEEVDLSHNSLEYVTSDFIPWKDIQRVNLQGNPWNCNCSLQWMLDELMPRIYKTDSKLLMDLRCSKPEWLRGRRFVHWLGRSSGVYCGHRMEKLRMGIFPQEEVEDVDVVALGMGPGMIAVIASVATVVVGLIVLAIIWQRRALRIEKEKRTMNYQCRNPRY